MNVVLQSGGDRRNDGSLSDFLLRLRLLSGWPVPILSMYLSVYLSI
jgi:hypothetical protein